MTLSTFFGIKVKTRLTNLLEKDEITWIDWCVLQILLGLSQLYKFGVFLRRKAKQKGLIKAKRFSIPTLCVGNIVAGGSGKTPMILMLCKKLPKSYKVAVISKGYLGKKVRNDSVIEVLENSLPADVGDEPLMIKRSCQEALVLVSKNRSLALNYAEEKGCDIALLDDGAQDFSVETDKLLLLLKNPSIYKKGYFLPRGYLRDSKEVLSEADFFGFYEEEKEALADTLALRAKDSFFLSPRCGEAFSEKKQKSYPLQGQKIGAISAIANPKTFTKALSALGAEVVYEYHLADHATFSKKALKEISTICHGLGAKLIVCTKKDYVKLSDNLQGMLEIAYLNYDLEVSSNRGVFERLVTEMESLAESYKTKRENSL